LFFIRKGGGALVRERAFIKVDMILRWYGVGVQVRSSSEKIIITRMKKAGSYKKLWTLSIM